MILWLANLFLALGMLAFLKAKNSTKLYPLLFISSFLILASVFTPYCLYALASLLFYVVVRDAVKNGYLTLEDYKPPVIFLKLTLTIIVISAIIFLINKQIVDLCACIYTIFMANSFYLLAHSRRGVFIRAGDYTALSFATALVVMDIVFISIQKDWSNYASMIDKYTYALIFLLSELRG